MAARAWALCTFFSFLNVYHIANFRLSSVPPLLLTYCVQVSFTMSPASSRARGAASTAHSSARSPATAAASPAAAASRRDPRPASDDDFSFRALVPAQAASHFNFLSQVARVHALSFPGMCPRSLRISCSLCRKSRSLTTEDRVSLISLLQTNCAKVWRLVFRSLHVHAVFVGFYFRVICIFVYLYMPWKLHAWSDCDIFFPLRSDTASVVLGCNAARQQTRDEGTRGATGGTRHLLTLTS